MGEEDIHMVGIHMVEKYYHPMNHESELKGMDTVEEHYHLMNHRPEVEGIDMNDSGMGEDITVELEAVEREPEGIVLMRAMERRSISELVGSGRILQNRGVQKVNPCLQVRTPIIVHHGIECRRVKKRVQIG
jgi:hypothetical protein